MRKYNDLIGQSMFTWILQELLDNFNTTKSKAFLGSETSSEQKLNEEK